MSYSTPRPLALVPTLLPLYQRVKNVLRQNDEPVRRLARKVYKVLGDRLAPEDGACVRRWCELELLRSALFAETTLRGALNPDGEPSGRVFAYTKLAAAQLQLEKELGMTPRARMEIQATGRHAPVNLVSLMAEIHETDDAVVTDGNEVKREPTDA